jgi:hypothetical protein
VNVGRDRSRVVERPGAHEPDLGRRVLAEDSHLASRATPDLLFLVFTARNRDHLRLAAEELDSVGLDQDVDDECAPRLPLTIQAMTAMDEERIGGKPVPNLSARAAAFRLDAQDLLLADE